jgi:hypothetical protein
VVAEGNEEGPLQPRHLRDSLTRSVTFLRSAFDLNALQSPGALRRHC